MLTVDIYPFLKIPLVVCIQLCIFKEDVKIFESYFVNYAVNICPLRTFVQKSLSFWHGFLHYYPIFMLYIEEIMKVRLKKASNWLIG